MFNCLYLSVNKKGDLFAIKFFGNYSVKLNFLENNIDFMPFSEYFDKTIERLDKREEVAFVL